MKLGFADYGHLVDVKGIPELAPARGRGRRALVIGGGGDPPRARALARSCASAGRRWPRWSARRGQRARARRGHAGRQPGLRRPALRPGDVPARRRGRGGARRGDAGHDRLPMRELRAGPLRRPPWSRASCWPPCACPPVPAGRGRGPPQARVPRAPGGHGDLPGPARTAASVVEARVAVGSVGRGRPPARPRPRPSWSGAAGDDALARAGDAAAAAARRWRTRNGSVDYKRQLVRVLVRARHAGGAGPRRAERRGRSGGSHRAAARRGRRPGRASWPPPRRPARRTPPRRRPRGSASRPRGRCR